MTHLKKLIFVVLFSFLLLSFAACAPVIYEDPEHVDYSPEETATPETAKAELSTDDDSALPFVQQGDVRIYFDPSVSSYVDDAGEFVPSASGDEAYSEPHPGFADFNFSPMQAHIYVADVLAYEESAEFATGAFADLYRVIEGMEVADSCVPELPLGTFYHDCDHQQFISNLKVVNFQNGGGVR